MNNEIPKRDEPVIEHHKLGIIDNQGMFRILIGNEYLTMVQCDRLKSDHVQSCQACCRGFSGPGVVEGQSDMSGKTCVKLLCTGRTMVFDRFLITPDFAVKDISSFIDFDKDSDEEIFRKLTSDPTPLTEDDLDDIPQAQDEQA